MEAYNSCCGGAGNCKPGDCEMTRALREENARLKEDRDSWRTEVADDQKEILLLTRERDDARAELKATQASLNAEAEAHGKALSEVARLEGLILDWCETQASSDIRPFSSLLAEARRIRAQREEGR